MLLKGDGGGGVGPGGDGVGGTVAVVVIGAVAVVLVGVVAMVAVKVVDVVVVLVVVVDVVVVVVVVATFTPGAGQHLKFAEYRMHRSSTNPTLLPAQLYMFVSTHSPL